MKDLIIPEEFKKVFETFLPFDRTISTIEAFNLLLIAVDRSTELYYYDIYIKMSSYYDFSLMIFKTVHTEIPEEIRHTDKIIAKFHEILSTIVV